MFHIIHLYFYAVNLYFHKSFRPEIFTLKFFALHFAPKIVGVYSAVLLQKSPMTHYVMELS